jgi:hypothetical protein
VFEHSETNNRFITLPVGVIIGASTILLMIAIGIIVMAAIIPIIGKVQSNRRRHVSEEILIHNLKGKTWENSRWKR